MSPFPVDRLAAYRFSAIALLGCVRRLAVRKGWMRPKPRRGYAAAFLPASAPSASRVARIVEATVVGLSAVIVLTAWQSGGSLATPVVGPPIFDVAFACLAAAAGLAVLAALLGRTSIGAGVMFASHSLLRDRP